ncbi:MAG: 1-(5-phosphoribosyl)-5-[(5-phosphoribosylamino)methylideneamino]imidazole-4-carboxamide isomerase [Anaerolineales bacterium]|nr:1-(5-phosphoribosyl)-5-[(5-phosphoribosylamino)methylideneamino]imidazole-4-carboxamide isomerase [Anaerolineales bacterium]
MSSFTVYPAIDLRGGRVVRLRQGDPKQETVYSDDPAETARQLLRTGVEMIHVINLDGAFNETQDANLEALQQVLATGALVQLGGGIRSLESIQTCMDLGVARVILSTVAVSQPMLVAQALKKYGPDRIVISIDVRRNQVYTHGWKEQSLFDPVSLALAFKNAGLHTLITTSIVRDGTGEGLNVTAAKKLAEQTEMDVIAAGGVDSLKDIQAAKEAALRGVIIGRALYDGSVSLKEALAC